MSLIVALCIVAFAASAGLAAQGPLPLARALTRVRVARGESRGTLRERIGAATLFRAWRPVDEETLRLAGLAGLASADIALGKLLAAGASAIVALVGGSPPLLLGIVAFAGFVAPSEWVRRRAAQRDEARRAALLPLLERGVALMGAGMTIEQTIGRLSETASPLAGALLDVRARAELGVPALDALAEIARREHLVELGELAGELARARRSGRPLLPILAERREGARLARRASRLEAASRVDAALSLVLVLAYLPALLLLVVVPLFLGLLRSLGT